jgi:hypothetical protein
MQKYGMFKDGQLVTSDEQLEGYKPIVYAGVPEFDQSTQYVAEGEILELDDHIEIGVKILDLDLTESPVTEENEQDFVQNPPWEDKPPANETEKLKEQIEALQGALDFVIMNY